MKADSEAVDRYIKGFPDEVQMFPGKLLTKVRTNAPGAVEGIACGMPACQVKGKPLVYFAGYKTHIGFYATPAGHAVFKNELPGYKQGKGSVQFPLNKPVPFDLIGQLVRFRVEENNIKSKQ